MNAGAADTFDDAYERQLSWSLDGNSKDDFFDS